MWSWYSSRGAQTPEGNPRENAPVHIQRSYTRNHRSSRPKSGEVDEQQEQSAEALVPKGPRPTHDGEEADCAPVIEEPEAGSEPAEQPPEPAPQEDIAADDPKESKVKLQEPAGLEMCLEQFVASSEGAGKQADQSAQLQDISWILSKAGQAGRPTLAEALAQVFHPSGIVGQKVHVKPPKLPEEGIPGPRLKEGDLPKAPARPPAAMSATTIVEERLPGVLRRKS